MTVSKTMMIGRVLVIAIAALLLLDAVAQFISPPPMTAAFDGIDLPPAFRRLLPFVTLACALTLAVPRLAVLGTVLTTGFLGGAISLHLRTDGFGSPPQLICAALGLALWAAILAARPGLRREVLCPSRASAPTNDALRQ